MSQAGSTTDTARGREKKRNKKKNKKQGQSEKERQDAREEGGSHLRVSQLPRLDEMPQGEGESEEDADAADGDVGDAEERVPAADERDGRDDDRLGSAKGLDGVVCRARGENEMLVSVPILNCAESENERTHEDVDLVRPRGHVLIIVPEVQFPKRRQPSRPHPDLEVLILGQIGNVVLRVPVRVARAPVRRRDDLVRRVGGRAVLVGFARPGDPVVGHVVGDLVRGAAGRVQQDRLLERVWGWQQTRSRINLSAHPIFARGPNPCEDEKETYR